MGPHKDPAQLPVDSQLKLLRRSVDKVQSQTSAMSVRLRSVQNEVGAVRTEVRGLHKRFDAQDQKFERLFDRIDEFVGRIDDQDKNIATAAFRKEEHETRIKKLETTVFATP